MSRFLQVVSVADAVRTVITIAPAGAGETILAEQAAGRVLAAPVTADTDIPGFDRSVVDGYAVRSSDTTGAGNASPSLLLCRGRIAMGMNDTTLVLREGECAYIPTGGVLPQGADAAVMVEYTEEAGDTILIKKTVSHGENVLLRDEDFKKGETVFTPGRLSRPRMPGCLQPAAVQWSRLQKNP